MDEMLLLEPFSAYPLPQRLAIYGMQAEHRCVAVTPADDPGYIRIAALDGSDRPDRVLVVVIVDEQGREVHREESC